MIRNQAEHIPGAPATQTAPQTCTVCGWVFASDAPPSPEPTATPVPDTSNLPAAGDESSFIFWAALLMMAGAGLMTMRRAKEN